MDAQIKSTDEAVPREEYLRSALREEDATIVEGYLDTRKEYRVVESLREEADQVADFSTFLKELSKMVESGQRGSIEAWKSSDGEIVRDSENDIAMPEPTELLNLLLACLPDMSSQTEKKATLSLALTTLVDKLRKSFGGMVSKDVSRATQSREIRAFLLSLGNEFGKDLPFGIKKLLSAEPNIPFGERRVSSLDMTAAYQATYTDRVLASYDQRLDAMLGIDELAIYDAYEWLRRNSRESQYIYDTPYTEHLLNQMDSAMLTRNGVLKFMLYGDAGVGKTRIAQEYFRRQGKETMVINFNYFTNFEDLIAQTVVTVDDGKKQESLMSKIKNIADTFGSITDEEFWNRMSAIFSLSKKNQYSSVEEMVQQYGADLGFSEPSTTEPTGTNRVLLREDFMKRMNALADSLLLAPEGEQDLKARYAHAAVLKANATPNTVVLFDEIDKAGPQAIEGLLSFLSLSPGDDWMSQVGKITIRPDFCVVSTSNSTAVGSLVTEGQNKGSQAINPFLGDRTEHIKVENQPVKDALMIAAIHLSDENGTLLINPEEQSQVIAALAQLVPQLRTLDISMPISNRSLKTFCSRLVSYDTDAEGKKRYFRVKDRNGRKTTVAEAFQLSLIDMKSMSLTASETEKVRTAFQENKSLISSPEIPAMSADYRLDLLDALFPDESQDERRVQWDRRVAVIQSVWEQPLLQAMGRLESEIPTVGLQKIEQVDTLSSHLYPAELLQKLLTQREKQQNILSRQKGLSLNATFDEQSDALYLVLSGESLDKPAGKKVILPGNFSVISSDQVGGAILLKNSSGEVVLFSIENESPQPIISRLVENTDAGITNLIDPLGRYVLVTTTNGLELRLTKDPTETKIVAPQGSVIVDFTDNGNNLLVKDQSGNFSLLQLGQAVVHLDSASAVQLEPSEKGYSFIGNTLLIDKNNSSISANSHPTIYTLS